MSLTKKKIRRRRFLTAIFLNSDNGLSISEAKELQHLLEEERDLFDKKRDIHGSLTSRTLLIVLIISRIKKRSK